MHEIRKASLKAIGLPDREGSRMAVLNSLGSINSRRAYDYGIRKFLDWYCAEPRLGFNRSVVAQYRSFLEQRHYAGLWCKLYRTSALGCAELASSSGSQDSRPNLWSRFGSAC